MYLSKKAVLEWLDDRRYKSPWIESFRERLESGAFDADTSEIQRLRADIGGEWGMKDKIKESQIEKIRNHYKDHFDVQFLISEIDRLKEERDKLIEGLRWYGETSRYNFRRDGSVDILADSGQRARNALKEIGVTVE